MKLTEEIPADQVTPHLKEGQYAILNDNRKYLYFKCPGCDSVISIADPPWTIDFKTLTALPFGSYSILHTTPYGCGWHGYLKNGELTLNP